MEKEVVNLKLPLVKVADADPWHGTEYRRENFPTGCFIIDDGYNYLFAWHDGNGYCTEMGLNRDNVLDALVEDTRFDEFKKGFDIIEKIENRLQQIARLCGETKDEVRKSEVRVSEKLNDQGDGIRKGFDLLEKGENIIMELIPESEARISDAIAQKMPKSGDGFGNILDIAKAAAVIQKPELIEKL